MRDLLPLVVVVTAGVLAALGAIGGDAAVGVLIGVLTPQMPPPRRKE